MTNLQLLASSDNLVDLLLELASIAAPDSAVQSFAQNQLSAVATPNRQIEHLGQSQGIILPSGVTEAVDKAVESYVLQSVGTAQFENRFLGTLINLEQIRIAEANQLATSGDAALSGAAAAQTAADTATMTAAQTLLTQLNDGTPSSGSGL
jgi:hypothetical protein